MINQTAYNEYMRYVVAGVYDTQYAEYIMKNGDRVCCDGDMLLGLMEECYLIREFVESLVIQDEEQGQYVKP